MINPRPSLNSFISRPKSQQVNTIVFIILEWFILFQMGQDIVLATLFTALALTVKNVYIKCSCTCELISFCKGHVHIPLIGRK